MPRRLSALCAAERGRPGAVARLLPAAYRPGGAGARRGWRHAGRGRAAAATLREVPGARVVRRATGLYHFCAAGADAPRSGPRDPALFRGPHADRRRIRPSGERGAVFVRPRWPWHRGLSRSAAQPVWQDEGGKLRMATDPLDIRAILGELRENEPAWSGLPRAPIWATSTCR